MTPFIEFLFGPSSNYISSCNEDDEFLYCPDAVIAVPAGLPWWIWLILVLFILLLGICVVLLFLSLNNALLDTDLTLRYTKQGFMHLFYIGASTRTEWCVDPWCQVLDFEIAVKLTIFLFSSCADGAEKPSEGCKMTVTAGAGFAMSSLMAIIAAILLLICEFFTVQCQFRRFLNFGIGMYFCLVFFCKSLKPFVNDLDTLNKLIS